MILNCAHAESLLDGFRPQGLVVDDNPDPLLPAIEAYMTENFSSAFVPNFEVVSDDSSSTHLDQNALDSDFLLLDNHYTRPIGSFSEGIEVGQHVLELDPAKRVFFYTAHQGDWYRGNTKRSDIRAFIDRPNVSVVDKSGIGDPDKLDQLCVDMIAATARRKRPIARHPEVATLLDSSITHRSREPVRIERVDLRRNSQAVRVLNEPDRVLHVSTKILKNAGVLDRHGDAHLTLLEFSGGQVLSLFEAMDLNEVPADVRNLAAEYREED